MTDKKHETTAPATLSLVDVDGWRLATSTYWSDDEPRILDTDLAERLGYERPADIRELVRRHIADKNLNDSEVFRIVRRNGERGRPAQEHWLTEDAALFIAMKSETPNAILLAKEVIKVFGLARRGLLPSQAAPPPPSVAEQTEHLARRLKLSLEMYTVVPGLFSEDFLRHKVEHAVALITGEVPAVADPLLSVEGYLEGRGLKDAERKKIAGTFGKKVKALYREKHQRSPGMQPRDINGSPRLVACYKESDRPLFDAVFGDMFGNALPAKK